MAQVGRVGGGRLLPHPSGAYSADSGSVSVKVAELQGGKVMSDRAYQDSLPKKRMGAGALIFDENGRFLLVNPTYKEPWEVPGGVVEANESPAQACVREVREELGLDIALERLLLVDYLSDSLEKVEALMFIFQGPTLTQAEIEAIQLQAEELSEYRFCTINEAVELLNHRLGRRVRRSLAVLVENGSVYMEDQEAVFKQSTVN